jgi:beta-lactamase class A
MNRVLLVTLLASAGFFTTGFSQTYSTRFEADEAPLSEGGRWTNNGGDWTRIRIKDGIACGTQTGTNTGIYQYNDSYAHLSGFPPDHEAWGTAHIARPNASCIQELEILLRFTSSSHRTTGYECFARCVSSTSSYVQIVRWDGPLGGFTYLADKRGTNYGLNDGDTLKAAVVGDVITVSVNGVEKARATDDTFKTGNPGIGEYLACEAGQGVGSNPDFGFSSFTARGLGGANGSPSQAQDQLVPPGDGGARTDSPLARYALDYDTATEPALQARLQAIDARLRNKYGMTTGQTAVGVLDLKGLRLAMIHPDRIEYAASVAKVGILLAYFQLHPEAATHMDSSTRRELGLMIKISSDEAATEFSRQMGLRQIQEVLNTYHFYDTNQGGGIWVGKHYGAGAERLGDPIADHSHAATVRQLLRFYLLLEQGKLVSPAASRTMRDIFASPDIPHDNIKFVKGLAGRDVRIIRKWGSWQDWLHDSAVVTGPGRHYVLVAFTHHPRGDEYLVELAGAVDDCLAGIGAG